MKKSSFVALILGIISGLFFALGMCMAMIPEWNAFRPGIIVGCVGIVFALITVFVWRKMEHKQPIKISGADSSCRDCRSFGSGSRHVLHNGMGKYDLRHYCGSGWHHDTALPDSIVQRPEIIKICM